MDWEHVFCDLDDFCQEFVPQWQATMIANGEKQRQRASRLVLSEILTILIGFHVTRYRDFKHYYFWLLAEHKAEFPQLVSYQRFVELTRGSLVPLDAYLMRKRLGEITGISFVDSTALSVCGNKRISRNRVFEAAPDWVAPASAGFLASNSIW